MFDYPNATIRIRKSIMAADANTRLTSDENFEWNVENEIRLFEAMIGHKPVGTYKHFILPLFFNLRFFLIIVIKLIIPKY